MKKILFPLVAFSGLLIASCEKKRCYTCDTTVVTYTDATVTSTVTSTKAHCNATKDEMEEIQEQGSNQTSRMENGHFVVVRTTTVCDY